MTNKQPRYTILWVDEEPDTFGLVEQCNRLGIAIRQYPDWELAKHALDSRFNSFSAIVLDDRCPLSPGGIANPDFLYQAVRELSNIYAQHGESLPWYVLASKSTPELERTLARVSMGERTDMENEWGRLFFRKNSDIEDLCHTIRHAVSFKKDNKIRSLYRDVFDTMDLYFPPDAKQTMLDILKALHFHEENRNFDPLLYYTQLRRILEHLFRAMNRMGILPDIVMGPADKVNLANSSLYLAGRDVNVGQGRTVRYRQPGQYVFPPVISQLVKSILYVANKNSHTVELDRQGRTIIQDYYNSLHSNNMLFGYALHLCDVIVWFGRNAKRLAARQS